MTDLERQLDVSSRELEVVEKALRRERGARQPDRARIARLQLKAAAIRKQREPLVRKQLEEWGLISPARLQRRKRNLSGLRARRERHRQARRATAAPASTSATEDDP